MTISQLLLQLLWGPMLQFWLKNTVPYCRISLTKIIFTACQNSELFFMNHAPLVLPTLESNLLRIPNEQMGVVFINIKAEKCFSDAIIHDAFQIDVCVAVVIEIDAC